MILPEIGLEKNWIYETIVTTIDEKGNRNSAPMGVLTNDLKTISMDVYKGTKTCRNILSTRRFTVNFVSDLSAFYNSLIGKSEDLDADAVIEAEVVDIKEFADRFTINARVVDSKIYSKPELINRARPLALECMIRFTRVNNQTREKIQEELRENLRVIRKVAPRSIYEEIVKQMLKKL